MRRLTPRRTRRQPRGVFFEFLRAYGFVLALLSSLFSTNATTLLFGNRSVAYENDIAGTELVSMLYHLCFRRMSLSVIFARQSEYAFCTLDATSQL